MPQLFGGTSEAVKTPLSTQLFGNSVVTPITIVFTDDNGAATTTLNAVDIIINSSTAGAAPAAAGLAAGQTSRHGALGALVGGFLISSIWLLFFKS